MTFVTSIATGFDKYSGLKKEVQLQSQQERIKHKLSKDPNMPGILAYHGLGSGKTLASIAAAEHLGGKANVVVPASLRENYRKEIHKYVGKPDSKYNVMSYEAASRKGLSNSDVTIFDEAHRLGREDSGRSQLATDAKGKVILLTGTPVRNEPAEALPLLRAIAKDRPIPKSADEFNAKFVGTRKVNPGFFARLRGVKPGEERFIKNKDQLAELIRGRVDYHPSKGEFPDVSHKVVEVQMTMDQTDLYDGLLNVNPRLAYKVRSNLPPSRRESAQLNAFLSGIRQVSNDPMSYNKNISGRPNERSPKIRAMFDSISKKIQKDPKHKVLVYSNYLQAGVMPLAQELEAAGIPHQVFHGGISDKVRKKIIEGFNNDEYPVLLVSGAGSEGLDLKGARTVQVMEPHWNHARVKQVIGRAVRNKSHAHLPEQDRNVEVEHYVAKPAPKSRLFGLLAPRYDKGADQYMMTLARNKQRLINDMLGVFQEEGLKHE